ncbi:MAG TPA: arsenite methyltransferase [Thermomicrobiaceae bacterium]|nr:arsenite methyltransferase [Thermomicrobiaceae bacterium]
MARQSDELSVIRESVKEHYAAAARGVLGESKAASCCGGGGSADMVALADYGPAALNDLPRDAVLASLGCGNPTALAELRPGEVVLDLGSGGGIDVLLSAKRVGPEGFAYGLDMTDEMLELAERNRAQAGVDNVTFLKGHIEEIPLPDASVDVIISNCVINLSGDKDRVLREAFRVLRPNGRFAVSDIVVRGRLLPSVRHNLEAWSACVAGALGETEYRDKLTAAGFAGAAVEVTAVHGLASLMDGCGCGSGDGCCGGSLGAGEISEALAAAQAEAGEIVSAFVRARKPA